jgi:glycosyltransferase involved in cell wall biosynthesis
MKILYHHRILSKDGQNVHIEELIRALKARGHELVVVGPAAARTSTFGADAGLVAILKKRIPKGIYELLELAYALVAFAKLTSAYFKHQPDCLYERYNLLSPAGVWLRRLFGIPMLSEVNAPIADERARYDGLALKGLARWSERFVWRGADYALPVTRVLAQHVRDAGVPESKIVIVPNGIDLKKYAALPDRAAAKDRLKVSGRVVLGFTGFIRGWHGVDRVIDYVAREGAANNLHFIVVGEGPAKGDLEARVQALGIGDRVTFAGLVGRDDIPGYLAAFDIALQPDAVPYSSPLKLFEYMAAGCAIVAPDQPNIREVLVANRSALLFTPKNPVDFERAVTELCRKPELRTRLGKEARTAIVSHGLTWDENARRVESLFEGLLAPRARPKAQRQAH